MPQTLTKAQRKKLQEVINDSTMEASRAKTKPKTAAVVGDQEKLPPDTDSSERVQGSLAPKVPSCLPQMTKEEEKVPKSSKKK